MRPAHSPDLARRIFTAQTGRLALLRASWRVAVGPEVARRTEILAVEGQTLRVRVPDKGWRRELHRMQGEILSRLREIAGGLAPRRLGFTEGPAVFLEPAAPSDSPPVSEADRPVPASLAGPASLIEDADLRAAFLRTATRYLRQRSDRKP